VEGFLTSGDAACAFCPNCEACPDWGLRLSFVGVRGVLPLFPAAGDGAIFENDREECIEEVLDLEGAVGLDLCGVGGKE
jgi:hypothetical protein